METAFNNYKHSYGPLKMDQRLRFSHSSILPSPIRSGKLKPSLKYVLKAWKLKLLRLFAKFICQKLIIPPLWQSTK